MNGFYLVGRIAQEPEKGVTSGGVSICRLRVAVNKPGKDQDEEEIFEVVLFRGLADETYELGQNVAITGRVQANNFEKEDATYYHANLLGNSVAVIS